MLAIPSRMRLPSHHAFARLLAKLLEKVLSGRVRDNRATAIAVAAAARVAELTPPLILRARAMRLHVGREGLKVALGSPGEP